MIKLEIGTVPVAPLVLHGVVGGGDNLPCNPNARLPCLFHKKKTMNEIIKILFF